MVKETFFEACKKKKQKVTESFQIFFWMNEYETFNLPFYEGFKKLLKENCINR